MFAGCRLTRVGHGHLQARMGWWPKGQIVRSDVLAWEFEFAVAFLPSCSLSSAPSKSLRIRASCLVSIVKSLQPLWRFLCTRPTDHVWTNFDPFLGTPAATTATVATNSLTGNPEPCRLNCRLHVLVEASSCVFLCLRLMSVTRAQHLHGEPACLPRHCCQHAPVLP